MNALVHSCIDTSTQTNNRAGDFCVEELFVIIFCARLGYRMYCRQFRAVWSFLVQSFNVYYCLVGSVDVRRSGTWCSSSTLAKRTAALRTSPVSTSTPAWASSVSLPFCRGKLPTTILTCSCLFLKLSEQPPELVSTPAR